MPTCPHFSSFWPEPKMTTNPESLQKWDPISTTKRRTNKNAHRSWLKKTKKIKDYDRIGWEFQRRPIPPWRVNPSPQDPCNIFPPLAWSDLAWPDLIWSDLIGSSRDFIGFSVPTWPPKPTQIVQKSRPRGLPILTSFFDRFWIDFWSILVTPELTK